MPKSTGGMTAGSPMTPRVSPLLPEQNVRPMFTCWVLCPVMSYHHISLKIRKWSLKKCRENVLASVVKPWMETVASGRPYVF